MGAYGAGGVTDIRSLDVNGRRELAGSQVIKETQAMAEYSVWERHQENSSGTPTGGLETGGFSNHPNMEMVTFNGTSFRENALHEEGFQQ